MIKKSHRVVLYLRVSTDGQTTANQELREHLRPGKAFSR